MRNFNYKIALAHMLNLEPFTFSMDLMVSKQMIAIAIRDEFDCARFENLVFSVIEKSKQLNEMLKFEEEPEGFNFNRYDRFIFSDEHYYITLIEKIRTRLIKNGSCYLYREINHNKYKNINDILTKNPLFGIRYDNYDYAPPRKYYTILEFCDPLLATITTDEINKEIKLQNDAYNKQSREDEYERRRQKEIEYARSNSPEALRRGVEADLNWYNSHQKQNYNIRNAEGYCPNGYQKAYIGDHYERSLQNRLDNINTRGVDVSTTIYSRPPGFDILGHQL